MISLEEEAKITGRNKEKVIEGRRRRAAMSDLIGHSVVILGGSVFGLIAGYGANHYYPENIPGAIACSGMVFLTTMAVGKSVYEVGRAAVSVLRTLVTRNPKAIREYLEETYPQPDILPPVFVNSRGKPKK